MGRIFNLVYLIATRDHLIRKMSSGIFPSVGERDQIRMKRNDKRIRRDLPCRTSSLDVRNSNADSRRCMRRFNPQSIHMKESSSRLECELCLGILRRLWYMVVNLFLRQNGNVWEGLLRKIWALEFNPAQSWCVNMNRSVFSWRNQSLGNSDPRVPARQLGVMHATKALSLLNAPYNEVNVRLYTYLCLSVSTSLRA